ncbi:hypothetical protein ABK905_11615 [Acerihabitans sp. KWT182]|uniref:Uncharacterized protein n=1 Tax=Acerihabitans sp. KWT182 TaxID=3157919 RepID=A0AAU7QEI6_9GAMM
MSAGVEYIRVTADSLGQRLKALLDGGGRMQMAYAWFPTPEAPEVRYLVATGPGAPLHMWICGTDGGHLPSLARVSPLVGLV